MIRMHPDYATRVTSRPVFFGERIEVEQRSDIYISNRVPHMPIVFWNAFPPIKYLNIVRRFTTVKSKPAMLIIPVPMFV